MPRFATPRARLILAAAVLLGCLGCDQATKRAATELLAGTAPQSYLGDTVRLHYVQNPGGFLSLGQNLPASVRYWGFIAANVSLTVVLIYVLIARWRMSAAKFVAVALLLAGGLGNLIDRVAQQGLVTDFLNVGVGPLRTGVFNVADMAVMAGGLALFFLLRNDAPREQATAQASDAQA